MRYLIVALVLFATGAFAIETITIPAKNGNVTLNHSTHITKFKCGECHGAVVPPGEITMSKEYAHGVCKGCHTKLNGPTKCQECHKK